MPSPRDFDVYLEFSNPMDALQCVHVGLTGAASTSSEADISRLLSAAAKSGEEVGRKRSVKLRLSRRLREIFDALLLGSRGNCQRGFCLALESPIGNSRPLVERVTCAVVFGSDTLLHAPASLPLRCRRVLVLLPPPHTLSFALSFQWARVCRWHVYRRYALLFAMAYASTIGGGWASVRNARHSFYWALRLFSAARALGDEATMRKCRVFIGYHQLWDGRNSAARDIFLKQLDDANASRDVVHIARCTAALMHEAHNPLYKSKKKGGEGHGPGGNSDSDRSVVSTIR